MFSTGVRNKFRTPFFVEARRAATGFWCRLSYALPLEASYLHGESGHLSRAW